MVTKFDYYRQTMAISTEQIVMTLKRKKLIHGTGKSALAKGRSTIITELINKLQKTLILEDLLSSFSEELAFEVQHSGYIFEFKDMGILIRGGTRNNNSCEYTLSIDNTQLGTLTFMRKKRFTDDELINIESLLGALLYPLKNALLYRQAIQSAHTDPLTGVLNRSTLDSVFQKETALTKRHDSALSLLMLDIDFFKHVNDTYGHAAGDETLKKLTRCIQETVRESDPIFRLGGEEFAILLNDTNKDGASLFAERLRKAVEATMIQYKQAKFNVTISIGVTQYKDSEQLEELMQRADQALYSAKDSGRNKVVVC